MSAIFRANETTQMIVIVSFFLCIKIQKVTDKHIIFDV